MGCVFATASAETRSEFFLLFFLIPLAALLFPCLERQAMIRRRMAVFGSIAKPLRERRQSNDAAATK